MKPSASDPLSRSRSTPSPPRWANSLRHTTAATVLGLLLGRCGPDESPLPEPGSPPAPKPCVVLVSIDSLRADHLGCYGYARDTSPALDRLAASGAVFENTFSSTSWTLPAHMALLTSLPDSVHGVYDNDRPPLDPARITLAELYRAAGYHTAAFVSGPYLNPAFGFAQGFEEYHDLSALTSGGAALGTDGAPRIEGAAHERSHSEVTNPALFGAVEEWLDAPPAEPWFLFVHVWDVHYDYLPPPPYDTRFDPDYRGTLDPRNFERGLHIRSDMDPRDLEHLIALYDGEIAWTDQHLGALFTRLDQLPLAVPPLIAVTADHGEEFFEHGRKGHRKNLVDEVLHIPLVLRWKDHLAAGTRVSLQSRILDIGPTLLDLCALAPNPEAFGKSLRPAIEGDPEATDLLAFSELDTAVPSFDLRSLRTPKYRVEFDRQNRSGHLYDLEADPTGHRLASPDAPWAERAIRQLQDFTRLCEDLAKALPKSGPEGENAVELDEATRARLRELGYLPDK